ncbi:MAG: flagellar biosynthesis protein FlhF [Cellulosilyticaceae bacterium]
MRILKIKGKDERIIHEQIKKEYGNQAMIISTQQEKPPGIRGFFQKVSYSVTIAVEDEESIEPPKSTVQAVVPEVQVPVSTQIKEPERTAEIDTAKLMLELKSQIEAMRQEVASFQKPATPSVYTQEQPGERSRFYSIVESLKQEGIHEEVLEEILRDTEDKETVEALAVTLYNNISNLLKSSSEESTEEGVIFFIGSTGVGKTTTIAKLTAEYVLNQKKEVTLFTADTYRIAAIEQLKTYADILEVPIHIIYAEEELENQLHAQDHSKYILIDTAGRSHKNEEQMGDIQKLLDRVAHKQVYLVMNMSTQFKDVKKIIDIYKAIVEDFQLIITKMDETDAIGNLMNIVAYAKKPIAYVTTGQNVPDDIEVFQPDEYVKKLLGRIKYE